MNTVVWARVHGHGQRFSHLHCAGSGPGLWRFMGLRVPHGGSPRYGRPPEWVCRATGPSRAGQSPIPIPIPVPPPVPPLTSEPEAHFSVDGTTRRQAPPAVGGIEHCWGGPTVGPHTTGKGLWCRRARSCTDQEGSDPRAPPPPSPPRGGVGLGGCVRLRAVRHTQTTSRMTSAFIAHHPRTTPDPSGPGHRPPANPFCVAERSGWSPMATDDGRIEQVVEKG